MTSWQIIEGDCLSSMAALDAGSAQTCVTSPPYYGLRDYGHDGQIGLEPTPDEYVARLVAVFREVRRVLRDDGTLWLNLGDSYASSPPGNVRGVSEKSGLAGADSDRYRATLIAGHATKRDTSKIEGVKAKDLLGIPWLVAFALRADGWYLRSEIIWAKPNPMPESVTDRPTKAHEQVFLLSKSPRYFYDAQAIMEAARYEGPNGQQQSPYAQGFGKRTPEQEAERRVKRRSIREGIDVNGGGQGSGEMSYPAHVRNKRTVWTVPTHPFAGAHFATFPPKLIEPMILAGSAEGDTVLDPFAGSGTTGMVALRHGRSFVGLELNPEYAQLARHRIVDDAPLLNSVIEDAA